MADVCQLVIRRRRWQADDNSNPSTDSSFPGWVFPEAGPGMFAAALRKLMYPDLMHRVHCLGKGGNEGKRYMMEAGIQKLVAQGCGLPDLILPYLNAGRMPKR